MRIVAPMLVVAAALSLCPSGGLAQVDGFLTLTRGRLVLVGNQPVAVTQEPGPAAVVLEAPPPPEDSAEPPPAPFRGALWVPGHWMPASEGFVWANGRFIAPKPGHAFVPPRWVVVAERHLFFAGFFVPHGVFVRSFFNTFHFSGEPARRVSAATRDRGPYWPIGASRPIVGTPSSKERGPFWPIGLGPPTVLNTRSAVVGLRAQRGAR